MSKQGYPGLVQVPPSDRWILRRRLLRWAFAIIAVVWGASAITVWLPVSNNSTDCQTGVGHDVSPDVRKDCDQSGQSVATAPSAPPQSESLVTEESPKASPAESHSPMPMPSPEINRPATQPRTDQASTTKPSSPVNDSVVPRVAPPQEKTSAASQPAGKPLSSPNPDTHLAEQGDAFAQYRLGRFYTQHGGPQAPESVRWYMKASAGLRRLAEAGNGEAMYVLGVMYAFGRGVAKDQERARRWLTQAVEHKVAAAHPVLASLEKHRGADPSPQVAEQAKR